MRINIENLLIIICIALYFGDSYTTRADTLVCLRINLHVIYARASVVHEKRIHIRSTQLILCDN